jgi:hypothetical protein
VTDAHSAKVSRQLTADQEAMVNFAKRWEPFRGGDHEIFPLFGISAREFYCRLSRLLDSESGQVICEADRRRLRQCCAARLANPHIKGDHRGK